MKRNKKAVMGWFCRGLFLFAFLLVGQDAIAAPVAQPSVIAIVDVQRLLQESLAAKSVQQQIEAQSSKFQSEIAAEETDLRKAEQELAKMRDEAPQSEAYAEREQKLRQRFTAVERHVQGRRKALDQAFTDSMNTVRKTIVEVVAAVAKERGVNLAMVKQQVIWNDSAIDITDEVLTRLNKALPKIDIKISPEDETPDDSTVFLKKAKPQSGRK